MFDDLSAIFLNQVVRKFRTYRALRFSKRYGHNELLVSALECASALYHFRDHIPENYRKSRSATEAECASYRLIADVTNCSKHSILINKTPSGAPLVSDAGSIAETMVCVAFRDSDGPYWASELSVKVSCNDGVNRPLDDALNETLTYWCKFLSANGLGDFGPFDEILVLGAEYLRRDQALLTGSESREGLAFRQDIQFFEFIVEQGKAMPISLDAFPNDLLRLILTVELVVELPGGGSVKVGSIDLSEEESIEFSKLDDPIDQKDSLGRYLELRNISIEKWMIDFAIGEGTYTGRFEVKPSYILGPSFPLLVSKMVSGDPD